MRSTLSTPRSSIRIRRDQTKRRRYRKLSLQISWDYTITSIVKMMRPRECLNMMTRMKRKSRERSM